MDTFKISRWLNTRIFVKCDHPFEDQFNGIWACSSLMHVPLDEMHDALFKLSRSMKVVKKKPDVIIFRALRMVMPSLVSS